MFKKGRLAQSEVDGTLPDLTVPIVISITGHRDIPAELEGTVSKKIEEFIRDLRKKYRHTKVIVQSALAPGADMIAARVALRIGEDSNNKGKVAFRAVIPCDEETFRRRSFEGYEHHWKEHLELLEKSGGTVILPDMGGSLKGDRFKYQLMCHSAYLVSTSNILIAVWDGLDKHLSAGGTSYTIECAHNGVDSALTDRIDRLRMGNGQNEAGGAYGDASLSLDDVGDKDRASYLDVREDSLIYHIPTYRTGSDEVTRERCSGENKETFYLPRLMFSNVEDGKKLSPRAFNDFGWSGTEDIPKEYREIFANMNNLNKRILSVQKKEKKKGDYTFEKLHSTAFHKLFDLDPYREYMEAVEGLKKEVEQESQEAGKDRQLITDSLWNKAKAWRKESLNGATFIEARIRAWKGFSSVLRSREDGLVDRHLRTLEGIKKHRDDCILKSQVVEDFASNREKNDVDRRLKVMEETYASADSAIKELKEARTVTDRHNLTDAYRYVAVNELATNIRDSNHRQLMFYIVITAFTSLFLALYLISVDSPVFILLYIASTVIGYVFLLIYANREVQAKYLGYRMLAETLRVRVYWNVLGIGYAVNDTCYKYRSNKIAWVKSTLSSWYLPKTGTDGDDRRGRLDTCECCWILDQYQYHKQKYVSVSRRSNVSKNVVTVFLGLSIILFGITTLIALQEIISGRPLFEGLTWDTDNEVIVYLFGEGAVMTVDNTLKLVIALLNIVHTAFMTYLTRLIYGGDLHGIMLNAKTFGVAFKRCLVLKMPEPPMSDVDRDPACSKSPETERMERESDLFRELGVQSIEEAASWYALHRTKLVSPFSYQRRNL